MANYDNRSRIPRMKYLAFKTLGFLGFFITGFVVVASYIPIHIKCFIAIPAFLIGIGSAGYSIFQSYNEEYSNEL